MSNWQKVIVDDFRLKVSVIPPVTINQDSELKLYWTHYEWDDLLCEIKSASLTHQNIANISLTEQEVLIPGSDAMPGQRMVENGDSLIGQVIGVIQGTCRIRVKTKLKDKGHQSTILDDLTLIENLEVI